MKWLIAMFLAVNLVAGLCYGQDSSTVGEQQAKANKEQIDNVKGKVNALEEEYLATKSTVDKLAKIKLSGYAQVQFRMAMDTAEWLDANGKSRYKIGDCAGGAFADGALSQFQVRRGRVKVAYDAGLSQFVVQLDCTPSGVTIKDAYAYFMEPWLKSIGVKGGVFDRPFGYEISYSSSSRESPERSRLFQTLFPGERDLGVQLDYSPSDNLPAPARILNFKGGLFTGNGIALETDANKDFIGRLGFSIPITSINMAIDGGASAYYGAVTNTDTTWARTVSKVDSSGWNVKTSFKYDSATQKQVVVQAAVKKYDTTWTVTGRGFDYAMVDKAFKKSDVGQFNKDYVRKYFGGDLQIYKDIPVVGGFSLKGEYIQGQQPATKGSSGFYNPGRSSNQAVYLRDFKGFYATYVQNINPIKSQLVVRYDSYDPNTKIEGADIDSAKVKAGGISSSDLKYSTVGAGWVYHWSENVKFVLYYDHVMNETMSEDVKKLKDANTYYTKDLKDDVLTFRIQYKF